jgi:RHH-type proline utilization regulon transcriptional repressor/proline dehydrogenase/delta 1-pyrroline-5-carboxylate dehydrogenase
VQAIAEPWLDAVRRGPAPFWALETLLREYPLSSAEGTALMRLAEALLRVPDRETAIALTADQLGRATFDPHGHGWAGALSARALALAKAMLPQGDSIGEGPLGKFGSEAVVAMALRAVQLLGRQFVLGESIDAAMSRADASHARHPGRASVMTCWARAHARMPTRSGILNTISARFRRWPAAATPFAP